MTACGEHFQVFKNVIKQIDGEPSGAIGSLLRRPREVQSFSPAPKPNTLSAPPCSRIFGGFAFQKRLQARP
jgi:hypothetical protein